MSVQNNIKRFFSRLTGRFHVPPGLLSSGEIKIMHISDTPRSVYPAVAALLHDLKPDVLIHTGDLVDDIKLEFEPEHFNDYIQAVIPFLDMLECSSAGEIYVVPGNHDNFKLINHHATRIRLVAEGEVLKIKGLSLGLAHNARRLPAASDYCLYGHNYARGPKGNSVNLNGLSNVNIILCPSGQVVKISYPLAINYDRKMNDCYGIPRTV